MKLPIAPNLLTTRTLPVAKNPVPFDIPDLYPVFHRGGCKCKYRSGAGKKTTLRKRTRSRTK